jgi:hypothetical protein
MFVERRMMENIRKLAYHMHQAADYEGTIHDDLREEGLKRDSYYDKMLDYCVYDKMPEEFIRYLESIKM